jgi:hypothetical protein
MRTRLLVTLALSACFFGCAKNATSIEIESICANPDPTPGCLYSDKCDIGELSKIWVDLALSEQSISLGRAYLVIPMQVQNQLIDDTDASSGHTNTHDAVITEARLSYEATGFNLNDVVAHIGSDWISAATTQIVFVPIIPKNVGDAMITSGVFGATTLEVTVKLRLAGHYKDETSFETAEHAVYVDVINGGFAYPACPTAGTTMYGCPQLGQVGSVKCL